LTHAAAVLNVAVVTCYTIYTTARLVSADSSRR
jgi:hypothetical protein